MPPPGPPPLAVAPPPQRRGTAKKTILRVAAVFIAIGLVAWFANRDAPVAVAPVTSPDDITAPAEPPPPQSVLRRRYAGTYENEVDGTSLWLHKNGKYSYEGYIQWGGDLKWWVVGRTIRVETYKNVDWAGRSDVKEDVYDIRRGGHVLVLRKATTRADAGTRYVKVSKDRT